MDKGNELRVIVETGRCITFFEKISDRENPELLWSCYGDPVTNYLIVKLEKGNTVFHDAVQSPLVAPSMKDRLWGMDISDEEAAIKLSKRMWERYKDVLNNL